MEPDRFPTKKTKRQGKPNRLTHWAVNDCTEYLMIYKCLGDNKAKEYIFAAAE